ILPMWSSRGGRPIRPRKSANHACWSAESSADDPGCESIPNLPNWSWLAQFARHSIARARPSTERGPRTSTSCQPQRLALLRDELDVVRDVVDPGREHLLEGARAALVVNADALQDCVGMGT